MSTVRVTTTVEVKDALGRHFATISHSSDATPGMGDNPRFFATYTRGACQANEQAINTMMVAQFGDTPKRTEL